MEQEEVVAATSSDQSALVWDQEFMDELSYLLTVSKHPRTLKLLQDTLEYTKKNPSKAKGGNHESHITDKQEKNNNTEQLISKKSSAVKIVSDVKPSNTSLGATRIKDYGWDQSDTFVKLYITTIPGVDKIQPDDVVKEFTSKSMMVKLVGVNGRNYCIVVNDLCGAIVPDQSFVKIKSGNVTICLKKKDDKEWPFLTGREKKLKDARETKPPKVDKDEDPGLGLMKLMKQMYDDGDDEMKRTIAKAWHESQEKRAKGTDDLP